VTTKETWDQSNSAPRYLAATGRWPGSIEEAREVLVARIEDAGFDVVEPNQPRVRRCRE
jgi:hypothetical protein